MNQENRKQVIVAGALGVVLVCVLVYQIFIAGGATPPKAPAGGSSASKQQTASNKSSKSAPAESPARLKKVDVDLDKLIRNVETVKFRYEDVRGSRNPMTPLVGVVFTGETRGDTVNPVMIDVNIRKKSVTGIIYNDYSPVAIVDDEVITEGHQYPDGVTVIRIEPKRVWFEWNGTQIPVDLKEL